MDTTIRKQLQALVDRVEGLTQLFVTDRDGVPISAIGVAGADTCIRPQLLTAYPQALEHTRKLIYGQQRSMVCQYGKYQMVFFNCTPLCITVIATAAANTGAILDLRKDLELIVEEISAVLSDHLPKDT